MVKMPGEENKFIKFQSIKHQQEIPFVIVFDFEAITNKINTCVGIHLPVHLTACLIRKHEAACFSYYIIHSYGLLYKPLVVYRRKDAAEKFMEMLSQEAREIEAIYKRNVPVEILSEKQKNDHEAAENCYLCGKKFTQENWKVLKYSHVTGRYRGPFRNNCNLKFNTA